MRENWDLAVRGSKVTLVPYRKRHVSKYHAWLSDPWMQQATASEPLSLEEEYEMQVSWRDDPLKCTFIVLANDKNSPSTTADINTTLNASDTLTKESPLMEEEKSICMINVESVAHVSDMDDIDSMIGDVNLFFGGDYDDPKAAEVEVMIAEAGYRGKGYARESVLLMMRYGIEHLGATRYFCKIGEDNTRSLALFQSLSYEKCNYSEAFREVELQYVLAGEKGEHNKKQLLHGEMCVIPAPDGGCD